MKHVLRLIREKGSNKKIQREDCGEHEKVVVVLLSGLLDQGVTRLTKNDIANSQSGT
jgi:hypothetical protein